MTDWPHPWAIRSAFYDLPGSYSIPAIGRGVLIDEQPVIFAVAMGIVISAHDIPNPRSTHAGPWTEGWKPLT